MQSATLLLLLMAGPVNEVTVHDYLMVFAADGAQYAPTRGHTFAAVVRVERSSGAPPRLVEMHSISWLPQTMKVRALALRPEKGHNMPLHDTLRHYICLGPVTMWGPYCVEPEFAERFKERVATIESCFRYKAASLTSPRDVCDCARAVEEMVEPRRRFIGIYGYGAAASSVVVQKFSPWMVDPDRTYPDVATLIGLDEYPLERRAYGEFTSKADQKRASR